MAAANTVTFTWTDTTGEGNALANDKFYGAIFNVRANQIIPVQSHPNRSAETVVVDAPAGWLTTDEMFLYGCFRRADGTDVSDTIYAHVNGS